MKRIEMLFLLVVILLPSVVTAEVTKKIIERYPPLTSEGKELPGNPKTIVYLDNQGKEVARERCDERGSVIETIGKIPDGIVKEYFENGALLAEYNYKNGILEGVSKGYYQNGAYRGEWNYKNGKLDGKIRVFHDTGKLNYEFNYKDDKREGISKYYDEEGNVIYEWNYKGDTLEGPSRGYYKDGKVRVEYNYKDGKREGISNTYDKEGKLLSTEMYKGGRKITGKETGPKLNPESDKSAPAGKEKKGE